MNFKTVQEAFNYWNGKSLKEIETRAQEVKGMIETDPDVDIKSLNIELTGLAEAKANAQAKAQADPQAQDPQTRSFTPVTGATFTGSVTNKVTGDVYASPEYRSAFFKNLMGKELTGAEKVAFDKAREIETRTDTYTTSGNSPVVIPTQTLNEIISKARTEGGLLAKCRAFNMPSKVSIVVATPSANAVWNTEGNDVDAEKANFVEITFDGNEIIKVFSISAKVKAMGIDGLESYLVDELTKCVLGTLEYAIVHGTGSGQGTGLEKGITWDTSNTVTVAKAGELSYKDIVSAMAKLKRGYSNGAIFAMNTTTLYNSVYGLTDANKRPLFVADTQGDTVGKILSKEIVIDDNIADNDIYYGNFNYFGYNMPAGVAVESSTQSSFKSGRVDVRGLAIADCKPLVSEAFVKITKATA
jgi:HK97 family phage major capsid protein